MDEFIDIFIKNKVNEIPDNHKDRISKFLPFYATVANDDLAYLFAYLHSSYNSLFQFLNYKLSANNHHYNAHESREFIAVIDIYKSLYKSLQDTDHEFELDNEYLNILNQCEQFLSSSGGSAIPEDFSKIEIIEIKPIFKLLHQDEFTPKSTEKKSNIQSQKMKYEKNKVFIVHGHDNETKQEVARFIESIGLEVIILHEKASRSMTIIEKIEYYSNEANFAIVLYTPCDKGRGAKETKTPARDRARQNVVFEHGYLMAKIGRENVCALVKGEIETPSDISGVVYTPLDLSGGWKIELRKELIACGYSVSKI